MKTLYFIRHTKASWDIPGVDDFHRPLMKKGIQKSKKAIKFLNERHIKADKIVSSPAVRALETARLIAAGIGFPKDKIQTDQTIYDGPISGILDLIYSTEEEVDSMMIFGHNPVITHLAGMFYKPCVDFLPTMGIACISFETDKWNDIPLVKSKSEFLLNPKSLPD